jgi:hypothetical protein
VCGYLIVHGDCIACTPLAKAPAVPIRPQALAVRTAMLEAVAAG